VKLSGINYWLMADAVVEALILDLLEWLAQSERSYQEVMDAWRTSCPRLQVWEDANDLGLVAREGAIVRITPSGCALLEAEGRRKCV
jgi:hypothetical protein